MAYDEGVAQRIREVFAGHPAVAEKKMFGGIAFMLRGHMCCGVVGDDMMARVGPEQYGLALAHPHAREMDFTGKPMKGYVFVASPGFESDADLHAWISVCERFNATLPAK